MSKVIRLHRPDSMTMPLADGATLRVTPFRDSPYVTLAFFGPGGGDAGGVILRAERAKLLASWLVRLADECGTPTTVLRRLRAAEGDPAAGSPEVVGELAAPEPVSLDDDTTLASFVRISVPLFADVCAVDVLEEGGVMRRLPVAHADPLKGTAAAALQRYPFDRQANHPRSEVFRCGRPYIHREILDAQLVAMAHDEGHLQVMRSFSCHSCVGVPLVAHGRVLGAATFARSQGTGAYAESDLPLALGVARRLALAVDNARLYREAQTMLTAEVAAAVARRGATSTP
jgi:GAF domain-containing protein